MLPHPFLLAKLPALVALKPPALVILWPVICVLVVLFVVVLVVALDVFVAVDFVVNVRPTTSRPNSYADLRLLSFRWGSKSGACFAMEVEGLA
jgi:hypothetical protein